MSTYVPSFSGDVQIFYGPPGTGKTHRLLDILEKELKDGAPTDRIAFVSFTREGARQGIRRACSRFGYVFRDFPYFRTAHSLAFHALELTKDSVMQAYHYRMFGKAIGMNFAGHYDEELHSPDDIYLFIHDLLRNNREYAERVFLNEDIDLPLLKFVLQKFKDYKEELKLLDYTDMIQQFIRRGTPLPVDVVFLDEAQDFTTLQWRFAEIAFRDAKRIYVAGDDDQAIYSWSGADVEAFIALEGKKEVLNISHRLPPAVLTLANTITKNIQLRVDKEYFPEKTTGSVEYLTDIDDAPLDYPGSYYILVRNRKYVKQVAEMLERRGFLYSTRDGPSIRRADLDSIEAWEKHRTSGYKLSPAEDLRIKQALDCDLADAPNVAWQEAFVAWPIEKREYIERILKKYPEVATMDPLIHVATIHTVKGGEADNVILYMCMSPLTYNTYMEDPDNEHRVFYVGATRASERLIIVYGNEPFSYSLEA